MSESRITNTITFAGPFDDAVQATRTALQAQGFGVLTEIDLQATLKKKLGVDFPRTLVLGACNPKLAYTALTAEPDVAALIPCNVVIRETTDDRVEVMAMDPLILTKLLEHPTIVQVAKEGAVRLEAALQEVLASR